MNIYIASSWKNQCAVELLTEKLRGHGWNVASFVENNHGEQKGHAATEDDGTTIPFFDKWVYSEQGRKSFEYDTHWAMNAELVIYIGPSGTDAWAEIGAAYANGRMIFGLWTKGEQSGLMRRMVHCWHYSTKDLLDEVIRFEKLGENNRIAR